MRVGVPKEIKDHEDRVGLVPSSVAELVHHGHEVLVERGAGMGAGLGDDHLLVWARRAVFDSVGGFDESLVDSRGNPQPGHSDRFGGRPIKCM